MTFYLFNHLQQELKKEGLPNSRMYLTYMESAGNINKPQNILQLHKVDKKAHTGDLSTKNARIYTQEEIDTIIQQVREMKNRS